LREDIGDLLRVWGDMIRSSFPLVIEGAMS
jgi:hypothetical protein